MKKAARDQPLPTEAEVAEAVEDVEEDVVAAFGLDSEVAEVEAKVVTAMEPERRGKKVPEVVRESPEAAEDMMTDTDHLEEIIETEMTVQEMTDQEKEVAEVEEVVEVAQEEMTDTLVEEELTMMEKDQ